MKKMTKRSDKNTFLAEVPNRNVWRPPGIPTAPDRGHLFQQNLPANTSSAPNPKALAELLSIIRSNGKLSVFKPQL